MFSEKGQTLIELVVVVGIAAIVVGALVFATVASLRNAQFSKNQSQATKLAQEGIERVRSGRDRNQCINDSTAGLNSWNGGNIICDNDKSIWEYRINTQCVNALTPNCYFNVKENGDLDFKTAAADMPISIAEGIPPATAIFRRMVILADDNSYATQKTVTVIVEWTDFSGPHQSKLTTILGKK